MNISDLHRLKSLLWSALPVICALLPTACRKAPAASVAATNFKVYSFNGSRSGFSAVKLKNNTFVAALQDPDDSVRRGSLLCVDAAGRKLWTATLPAGMHFTGIAATGDGGFAITERKGSSITYDDRIAFDSSYTVYVSHYTAEGNSDWTYTLQEPRHGFAVSLCAAQDGNSIAVASSWGAGIQPKQPYHIRIINLALNGALNSIREIITPEDDSFAYWTQKICAVNNGFVITGSVYLYDTASSPYLLSYSLPGTPGYFVLKTDVQGNLVWNYNKPGDPAGAVTNGGEDICTAGGNTIIVARDSSMLVWNYNYRGNYMILPQGTIAFDLFDAGTGALRRTVAFPAENASVLPYITRTTDNHYLIAATSNYTQAYPWQVFLLKTDENLNPLWQRTLDIPYPAQAFGALETDEGSYLVFANIQTFGNERIDIAVIRTDTNGDIVEE